MSLALPSIGWALNAAGDLQRQFPDKALRGTFEVVAAHDILLNGEPTRLSPGSRIHDTSNRLVLSNTLIGVKHTVNYTREAMGMVHEVWLLTPAEAAQKRATTASNP